MKYTIQKFFKSDQRISQRYGERPDYYKQFGFAGHEGVDFATPVGTEFFAPFDGIVLRDTDNTKEDAYGGKVVLWDPTQRIAIWFCHLLSNRVILGQTVKKGELIGYTGNTGNSTGAHCHVNFCETDINGNRLNTTNGYKGFLDILSYCEFKDATNVPPPPTTSLNVDLGGLQTVLETYGIISIETLKSKLIAKDQYIKNHPDVSILLPPQPVLEEPTATAPPEPLTPDNTPPPIPPAENSLAVLFSAFVTLIKGLFGKKSDK